MGSSIVKEKPKVDDQHYTYEGDQKLFTEDQRVILDKTWPVISRKKVDYGIILFQRLFEINPDAKRVFTVFDANEDSKELSKCPHFRGHALRLMQSVDTIIEMNYDIRSSYFLILTIGSRHAAYGVPGEYFESIPPAYIYMVKQVLGKDCDIETEEAWSALMKFVINTMQKGLNERKSKKRISVNVLKF